MSEKRRYSGKKSIEEWEAIGNSWWESGISQQRYAYRNEIPFATFQKWICRLRDTGKIPMREVKRPDAKPENGQSVHLLKEPRFVAVVIKKAKGVEKETKARLARLKSRLKLGSEQSQQQDPYCTLTFCGGSRVVIEEETGIQGLRDLVLALVGNR